MSYCHECGTALSGTWEPCPECEPIIEFKLESKLESKLEGELESEEKGTFDIPPRVLAFSVISFLVWIPLIVWWEFINAYVLITGFVLWVIIGQLMTTNESEENAGIIKAIGTTTDASDGNRWLRNRFLLMNLLAIVAAAFGVDSIAMNHFIFWGALLLGMVIWSIPSKQRGDSNEVVEELFDD